MTLIRYHGWLLVWFLLAPVAATAEELAKIYDTAKLSQEKARFDRRINEIYARGIWPTLTDEEKRAIGDVELSLPLVGKHPGSGQTLGPLDFYSYGRGGRPVVALPVLSLLFLEDICVAYAWLYARGYSAETIDEYVTMLRYKKAADFAGGRYPPPLKALQIPDDALSDRQVDGLSLRFRNSAFAFILAHELGHIRFRHRGYEGTTTAQARSNEEKADRFALDVLKRTSTIPMGAILFFQSQAYFMPSKGQLKAEGRVKSDQDWQSYLDKEVTHPLTADRLRQIALHMDRTAGQGGAGVENETLRYIAKKLGEIADILGLYDELQGCMAVVAYRANPNTLGPRRPGALTATLLKKWCGGKK
jgi:hypothetical protein